MSWRLPSSKGCNPDLLAEISYGEIGTAPMMENVNSGRASPIRGRTMKEYEQQIGSLKKENFDLKLRIYFLEERIDLKFSKEDIIKTNIELKVQCESYKRDNEEKKHLLEKASSAIDTLSSQSNRKFEMEVQAIKEECEERMELANKKVGEYESQLKDSEDKLEQLEDLRANLGDRDREIMKLNEIIKKTQEEFKEFRFDSDREKAELKEELEQQALNVSRRDRDIKDEVEDAHKKVAHLEKRVADKDDELLHKDELVGNLEDLLRTKEKELGDAKTELNKRMKLYTNTKAMAAEVVKQCKSKTQELQEKVNELEKELEKTKAECDLMRLNKHKDDEKIVELEENAERLVRSLGKKEGELDNFRDLLEQAQGSLCKSEAAVDLLQKQLEQERKIWKEEKMKYNDIQDELKSLKVTVDPCLKAHDSHQHVYEASQQAFEAHPKPLDTHHHSFNTHQQTFDARGDPHQHFHINIHSSHTSKDGAPTTSDVPTQVDTSTLHKQIAQLEAENKRLKDLLEATEQTAHCQTQKMKRFKQMLADRNILTNSDVNLAADADGSSKSDADQSGRRSRARSDTAILRGRSMSPTPYRKRNEELEKLQQENEKLLEEIKSYKNVLKFIQSGSPSPDSSVGGCDGEVGSTEIPYKMLSRWFDQLDKFLTQVSATDPSSPLPQLSTGRDVNLLRKGLVQARDALQSLSSTTDWPSAEGRESPDSGCSDNPASLQNNSLKSPLGSPSNSKSGDNSPRSNHSSPRYSSQHREPVRGSGTTTQADSDGLPSQGTEILRASCGDYLYDHGSSLINCTNMTDVFKSEQHPMVPDFSMASCDSGHKGSEKGSVRFSLASESHNISPPHITCHSPPDMHDSEKTFYKTLSESRLQDMTGIPDTDDFSSSNAHSMSTNLLDITSSARADSRHHIEQMNKIIQSYERVMDTKNKNPNDLYEHMMELKRLRIQLENQLRHIEMLQEQLKQMSQESEEQIRQKDHLIVFLRTQLQDNDEALNEKIYTITNLNVELTKRIENAQMAEMEMETLQSRIHQLEGQRVNEDTLREYRSQIEQLTQDLEDMQDTVKTTVTQFEHEQEEVHFWKTEVNLCKDTIDGQTKQLFDKDSVIDHLQSNLNCKERELADKDQEINNKDLDLAAKDHALIDKKRELNDKERELRDKNEVLDQQDRLCQDLEKTVENLVSKNKDLSNQMEEHKLNCADYRKQIEKQNVLNKDLKERVDRLRADLTESISNRESLEKSLVTEKMKSEEDEKRKEKLKYNLTFMKTEYAKQKYKLNEAVKKVQEKRDEINTLQVALEASEKLISAHELTDDEKHNYILTLLQEVKALHKQLATVVEQNDNITRQMTEMTQRPKKMEPGTQPTKGRSKDVNVRVEANITLREHQEFHGNKMSSANTTWPTVGDLKDELRTDSLSTHLPIRKRTLGGPAQSDLPLNSSADISHTSTGSLRSSNGSFGSAEKSLSSSLPCDGGESCMSSSSSHFSVPGPIYKQKMADECLLYNVNDSPRTLAGLTQYRIDSDVRSLFSIGMIDHFEKLKKMTHECHAILKGMSCRITERLKKYTSGPASEMIKSVEYGTLKELSFSVDNVRICVDSQLSMIAGFWTSELPAPNENGEFVNQKLLQEKDAFEDELSELRMRCQALAKGGLSEDQLCESLLSTLGIMAKARQNFEDQIN